MPKTKTEKLKQSIKAIYGQFWRDFEELATEYKVPEDHPWQTEIEQQRAVKQWNDQNRDESGDIIRD